MRAGLVLALIAAASLAVVPMASAKKKKHKKKAAAGFVVSQTNDTTNNKLIFYKRRSNGNLYGRKQVSTGGQGSTQNVGCGPNCPILDSSGAVDATKNGKLVFVANAGSDSISSFRLTKKGPKLVDQEQTMGDLPESVTAQGGLVYALNVNSRNITGFKYNPKGQMTLIDGSTEGLGPAGGGPLGAMAPPAARQIGFDRSGDVLIVSDLLENVYDVFVLGADSTPGPPTTHTAQFPLPFGFAFDNQNRLIGSELGPLTPDGHATGNGHGSSYATSGTGTVTDINTVDSGGVLPCWVAITPNGKYAYVVNTGGGDGPASVARYRIESNGALTSLGAPTPAQDGEFALTDANISRNGKNLYVLAPGVKDGDTSGIYRFKIGSSGGLTFRGITGGHLAVGASGLDAR